MCGRYTLMTDEEYADISKIIEDVQKKLDREQPEMALKTGEIFPTNLAPILTSAAGTVSAEAAVWGFPHFKGSGVIINARSETAGEKPMFQKSMYTSRCVVPTTGFFEWDKAKTKYLFNLPEQKSLYLAGLLGTFASEKRYVILTADANRSMSAIHNRMPVILTPEQIAPWLTETDYAMARIQQQQPELAHRVVS